MIPIISFSLYVLSLQENCTPPQHLQKISSSKYRITHMCLKSSNTAFIAYALSAQKSYITISPREINLGTKYNLCKHTCFVCKTSFSKHCKIGGRKRQIFTKNHKYLQRMPVITFKCKMERSPGGGGKLYQDTCATDTFTNLREKEITQVYSTYKPTSNKCTYRTVRVVHIIALRKNEVFGKHFALF